MIQINDNKDCCGCSACVQKCPKKCIAFTEDVEGFLYPQIDISKCIECGLCEKVCPVINQSQECIPIDVYAAMNPNIEIRLESSSGGVFTQIAEHIIDLGGVVFGVKWNHQFLAVHDYTDTKDGLKAFRGSKYVQSQVGETFIQAEKYLKKGRYVLFSGTSCQISALKLYLRKDYSNLVTLDLVCHGVPSPKIWREYLSSLQLNDIGDILHKDKITGWRGYSFSILDMYGKRIFTERASYNKYLNAFVDNLILRPSCFDCPSKAGKSQSDITIADFWGVEQQVPKMDDNKGTSLICINTQKGKELINQLGIILSKVDYNKSIQYNSCLVKSTNLPVTRRQFWENYCEYGIEALPIKRKENIFIMLMKKIINRIAR